VRLLAKLMRLVLSMIITASGLSSKKPWNSASLLSLGFATASQSVRSLRRAGLSVVLGGPLIQIVAFVFFKAQLSSFDDESKPCPAAQVGHAAAPPRRPLNSRQRLM
jgi:hypothetical protein